MYRPIAFKVTYTDETPVRVATCGGMDSEFSHMERMPYQEILIAPDMETAVFLWGKQNAYRAKKLEDIQWFELGEVSTNISIPFHIY
jgi:hypothetical protein